MAFWQLTLSSSPETTDGLTNFLWEHGALGVVEEEVEPEPARLLAFFPETASSSALLNAVCAYRASLDAMGFAVGAAEPEIAPLLDGAWASAWQQSFPPRAIGERLLVLPPWEVHALGGRSEPTRQILSRPDDTDTACRIPLVIEPGRAFGTGHHGSTEGCLVLVERVLGEQPAPRVLDIGTGSGILAVAAAKLGAAAVLAIDVDPDAVAAARANADRNDCAARIEIALASPETLAGDPFPVVVANLLAHTHLAFGPLYSRLVARGGALVLGGILADEDEQVAEAFGAAGFSLRERLTLDDWSSLWLTRRHP